MSLSLNPALVLLPTLFLGLAACKPSAESDWPEVKGWVRGEFPDVPLTTVDELRDRLAEPEAPRPVLLDARAPEEFAVSHLLGARNAPTEDGALAALEGAPKDTPIVVYCSIGYRSAVLTRQLAARGYTEVRNLEGSIFEWANRGYPVYLDEEQVECVHPFDAEWGRLLERSLWSEQ